MSASGARFSGVLNGGELPPGALGRLHKLSAAITALTARNRILAAAWRQFATPEAWAEAWDAEERAAPVHMRWMLPTEMWGEVFAFGESRERKPETPCCWPRHPDRAKGGVSREYELVRRLTQRGIAGFVRVFNDGVCAAIAAAWLRRNDLRVHIAVEDGRVVDLTDVLFPTQTGSCAAPNGRRIAALEVSTEHSADYSSLMAGRVEVRPSPGPALRLRSLVLGGGVVLSKSAAAAIAADVVRAAPFPYGSTPFGRARRGVFTLSACGAPWVTLPETADHVDICVDGVMNVDFLIPEGASYGHVRVFVNIYEGRIGIAAPSAPGAFDGGAVDRAARRVSVLCALSWMTIEAHVESLEACRRPSSKFPCACSFEIMLPPGTTRARVEVTALPSGRARWPIAPRFGERPALEIAGACAGASAEFLAELAAAQTETGRWSDVRVAAS